MPEPMFLVVVSGRSGAAVCCHNLQTLIQGSDGHFKEQPLSVWCFYWKISPRVGSLIVLAVKEIHADRKAAIPVSVINKKSFLRRCRTWITPGFKTPMTKRKNDVNLHQIVIITYRGILTATIWFCSILSILDAFSYLLTVFHIILDNKKSLEECFCFSA